MNVITYSHLDITHDVLANKCWYEVHFPKQHSEDIDEVCIEKLPLEEIKAGIKLAKSIEDAEKSVGSKAKNQRSQRSCEPGNN